MHGINILMKKKKKTNSISPDTIANGGPEKIPSNL